jgi:hypothetical protein
MSHMPSFWNIPSVQKDMNAMQLAKLTDFSNEVVIAMGDSITRSDNVKAYRKNDNITGMSRNLREMKENSGTVMLQYDGRNKDSKITKNFKVMYLSSFLRQESEIHKGNRSEYKTWKCIGDRDFSPHHGYYNIEGNTPVRLFVDFDEPARDASLMKQLDECPSKFWDAIASFIKSLANIIPGYKSDWLAVYKSSGTKLSAHIHDLRIWAHDVSSFKDLVSSVCCNNPETRVMLEAIVDIRVYHGSRAWRMPGHCKRAAQPRFLSLGPDTELSGAEAISLFESSLTGERAFCVAWAAFCHPHVMSNITMENGFCVASVTKRSLPTVESARPLKHGKVLIAPWD